MSAEQLVQIDTRLDQEDETSLLEEVRADLLGSPRRISSRFHYDDEGSRLFEKICELPEYYQTRTEAKILTSVADDVVAMTGAEDLVELGSGASTKTRILLDAMSRVGRLRRYIPVDVSKGIVHRVVRELVQEYKGLRVHAVIADLMSDLRYFPTGNRQLVIFLGGTIGNLSREEAVTFLQELAGHMQPDGYVLIGTDLVKDARMLHAAYNDSQGVTAAFNRNILRGCNEITD